MTARLNMSRLVLGLQIWAADVREGFVEIMRHSLAVFGLAVVLVSVTFWARPNLQASASELLLGWLEIRQTDTVETPVVNNAATRATTKNLKNLTPDQLAVTRWLSRKYRVSAEPLGAMVAEAWSLGERSQLAPHLILAIMAVESRFNPFASGSQGAVGLMQIEVKAHAEALGQFGGQLSAFDPLTNVRVGVRHLQGLIEQTETLEEALWLYGSSSGQASESQYVERVLAEQQLLDKVTERQSTAALAAKGLRAQL
ncbi:MAG: lytic transglycosylase domain-containing protein [Limnohabitans sp.]|mgnify:FL=1|jgi:soluble lytic murein transglycosylase-like protein|uniref:lytic transglycosylase domain-containing protein n=1 Tax=Limnohabitans sp. TaxID=1907725 RepID=UPI001B52DE39|nr:lytic transglycosylase domain-containing protein [Limnohabitans sp.]MBP6244992.1 lytic transglycosylase domain-containing protein [Limnohabitans sp.]